MVRGQISAASLHANVFPEERWDVQVLAFNDRRLAFFETSARHRFELQDFLLRLNVFFFRRLGLFFNDRFFLRRN